MVRPITVAAQAKLEQEFGLQFRPIIQIDWGGATGTKYYSTTTTPVGAITPTKNIQDAAGLAGVMEEFSVGTVATTSLVLNDLSGDIKSIIDITLPEGKPVTIYKDVGLTETDLITVFVGKITGPVIWSEGERTFKFDVISTLLAQNVGFAPTTADVAGLHRDAEGKAWPLVFGSCVHVPAMRVFRTLIGSTKNIVHQSSTTIYVENGDEFPQSTSIDIEINGIIYTGSFSGETFTVTVANKPKYTGLSLLARDLSDPDNTDGRYLWINGGASKTILGHWCEFTQLYGGNTMYRYGYCERQEGNKCRFRFVASATADSDPYAAQMDQFWTVTQVAPMIRDSWSVDNTITWEFGPPSSSGFPIWEYKLDLGLSWWITPGAKVTQVGVNDVYVANLIPSSLVKGVYGVKTTDQGNVLQEIPTDYYTVSLSDSIGGKSPTTLTFTEPLEERKQRWTGDVYVTLKSSQGKDVANHVLKYIIETYTNLTVDTASFNTVSTAVASKYPVSFYYSGNADAITVLKDIAWQARIGLTFFGTTVRAKYLSKQPTSDYTIDETKCGLKSLVTTYTEPEDLVTRFKAQWREDGYNANKTLIKDQNVATFGLKEQEFDFYIYNIQSLVDKSATFWANRLANIWRKVRFTTFMDALKLELLDTVTVNLLDVPGAPILSIIRDTGFDQRSGTIQIEVELPSKGGESSVDSNYWPSDASDTPPSDPVDDFVFFDEDIQQVPEYVAPSIQRNAGGTSGGGSGLTQLNVNPGDATEVTDGANTIGLDQFITLTGVNPGLNLTNLQLVQSGAVANFKDFLTVPATNQMRLNGYMYYWHSGSSSTTGVRFEDGVQVKDISGHKIALNTQNIGVHDPTTNKQILLNELIAAVNTGEVVLGANVKFKIPGESGEFTLGDFFQKIGGYWYLKTTIRLDENQKFGSGGYPLNMQYWSATGKYHAVAPLVG